VLLSESPGRLGAGGGWQQAREAYVVVCSNQPLPLDTPRLGDRPGEPGFEGMVLADDLVAQLLDRVRPAILTDDFAPVDNLLAPVIRRRGL
jgi:hypothetical protein